MTNIQPIRPKHRVHGDQLECTLDDLEARATTAIEESYRLQQAGHPVDMSAFGIACDTIRLIRQYRKYSGGNGHG